MQLWDRVRAPRFQLDAKFRITFRRLIRGARLMNPTPHHRIQVHFFVCSTPSALVYSFSLLILFLLFYVVVDFR